MKSLSNAVRFFLAISAVVSICAANADTLGYVEGGTPTTSGGGYGGGAFDFTVSSTISVTKLGFYAISIGGGDTPHVYLWDVTTSTMLADTGSLQGMLTANQWNYKAITPVTLTPGDTYQVSAPVYFTPIYASTSSFSYGAEITPSGFYDKGSGFGGWTQTAPYTNADLINVPTDANFQYTISEVPEPSTIAAGVLATLTVGFSAIQSRRRRAA